MQAWCHALAAALLSGAAPLAQAAAAWDEAASGNRSGTGLAPTGLTLLPGENTLRGTTGRVSGAVDRDHFVFERPAGGSAAGLPGWTHDSENDTGTDIRGLTGVGAVAAGAGRRGKLAARAPCLMSDSIGSMNEAAAPAEPMRRRPRSLALELVETLGARIRDRRYGDGERLPTEAAIMEEFGVSRTVVREALSKLQAAGLVETRHGIGTFVLAGGQAAPFRVAPEQLATLQDVIAVLELRIAIETEAAALAAQRRTDADLDQLRAAVAAFADAVEAGRDAVAADFQFHAGIARATQNTRFADLIGALGQGAIPRARLAGTVERSAEQKDYLRRVNTEHESILDAIAAGDAEAARAAMRTHLANSRERRRRLAAAAAS